MPKMRLAMMQIPPEAPPKKKRGAPKHKDVADAAFRAGALAMREKIVGALKLRKFTHEPHEIAGLDKALRVVARQWLPTVTASPAQGPKDSRE